MSLAHIEVCCPSHRLSWSHARALCPPRDHIFLGCITASSLMALAAFTLRHGPNEFDTGLLGRASLCHPSCIPSPEHRPWRFRTTCRSAGAELHTAPGDADSWGTGGPRNPPKTARCATWRSRSRRAATKWCAGPAAPTSATSAGGPSLDMSTSGTAAVCCSRWRTSFGGSSRWSACCPGDPSQPRRQLGMCSSYGSCAASEDRHDLPAWPHLLLATLSPPSPRTKPSCHIAQGH